VTWPWSDGSNSSCRKMDGRIRGARPPLSADCWGYAHAGRTWPLSSSQRGFCRWSAARKTTDLCPPTSWNRLRGGSNSGRTQCRLGGVVLPPSRSRPALRRRRASTRFCDGPREREPSSATTRPLSPWGERPPTRTDAQTRPSPRFVASALAPRLSPSRRSRPPRPL
jgi:hypothetical protein